MSLRGVALTLIVVLIGASALAFGSVEDWAGACLRFGLLVAAVCLVADRKNPASLSRVSRALLLPLVALVLFGFVQSVPVPGALIRALSPKWASLRGDHVPVAGAKGLPDLLIGRAVASGASVEPGAAPPRVPEVPREVSGGHALSVAPLTTRDAVLAWITAGLALACAGALARRTLDRYRLLWALAVWSGVLGAIAILARVAGSSELLWIRPAPPDTEVLGPFVNPNHFAAFVELGTLVALGLVLAMLCDPSGRVTKASIRAAVLDRAWALPRLLVLGGCAVLGMAGMVLSRSRAGNLAFLVGLLALLAARRLKGVLVLVLVLAVCLGLAVGIVSWIGSEGHALAATPFAASAVDASFAKRWDIWGRSLKIVHDFPIVGSGLGTFRYAYALYDRPGEWMTTDQAHNDYLQIVAETGLVGAALLLWALYVLAARVLRPIARNDAGFRWTTAACMAAVLALAVHAMFEFGLQIPAVALEFAVTLGILSAIAGDDARSGGGDVP